MSLTQFDMDDVRRLQTVQTADGAEDKVFILHFWVSIALHLYLFVYKLDGPRRTQMESFPKSSCMKYVIAALET